VAASNRSPFEAFCSGSSTGVSDCKQRTTGRKTVRRGDPKVASRGVPTEVGPEAQDTQREHDNTSHGVRFLSARKAPVIVARRFTWPTPSALRVSHPLDGFLPPEPCGFVSRHSRP